MKHEKTTYLNLFGVPSEQGWKVCWYVQRQADLQKIWNKRPLKLKEKTKDILWTSRIYMTLNVDAFYTRKYRSDIMLSILENLESFM